MGDPGFCPPLASPALAQPGRRKREPRADTSSFAAAAAAALPCLLLPPPRDPPCPQLGEEEAGAERRGSLPAPRRLSAQPARRNGRPARPGGPHAAPEHLRAPARARALSAPRYR